jgi:hypothetical protein
MHAIAMHDAAAADRALESFVAPTRPEWLRSDTAFWLGNTRGEAGRECCAHDRQRSQRSRREKVTFGLSQSQVPAALTTLLNTAKNDRSTKVRSQALFWLAQKAGARPWPPSRRDRERSRHRGEEKGRLRPQPTAA